MQEHALIEDDATGWLLVLSDEVALQGKVHNMLTRVESMIQVESWSQAVL